MIRRIIEIDREKCNGCGACVRACHEGAIALVDGKAQLMRDDYCDGMGDCLPNCPADAIRFVEREALAYDEAAVKANMAKKKTSVSVSTPKAGSADRHGSRVSNWPVQLKLTPVKSKYFDGAHLLIAADCTAYAYGSFHEDFIDGRTLLIGCSKLDAVDYAEKLGEILYANDVRSVTLVRMQVPCCGGLELAAKRAIAASGKDIPLSVVTVASDGRLL
ncbi:MAG: 4Fe-4S binding protein [Oscillospiraceae bacterium]|nr:4Fe-4S binding protein [Oscillospiraceae bacterium]